MKKNTQLGTAENQLVSGGKARSAGVTPGGALAFLGVIAVTVILSLGGYEVAVSFTSGAIEGFINGLE